MRLDRGCADGMVVTNTHIVADAIPAQGGAPRRILCTLQDGRCLPAELVNFDWCASDEAYICSH